MKYFVVSDVHGYHTELIEALMMAGFDSSKDTLISLGDAIDRGPQSIEVVRYFMTLKNKILIQGNHEDLLNEYDPGMPTKADSHNGTTATYRQFYFRDAMSLWKDYQAVTVNAVEIGDYILTHGYLPCNKLNIIPGSPYELNCNWRNANKVAWEKARWLNGMYIGDFQNVPQIEDNKKVIVGHYHTSYGNVRKNNPNMPEAWYTKREFEARNNGTFEAYLGKNVIGIDGCTAWTGIINIFVFESDAEPIIYKREV